MNRLKAGMAQGGMIAAAWAGLGSPDVAEIMVRHGWRTIIIDGEHGLGDLETWVHMARAIEAAGGEVILRIPDGQDTTIKKALDRGFRSFIVPMISSAEQARQVIASFHYPTRGRRGYAAPVLRCSDWGSRPDYARDEASDEVFVMLQCEDIGAVAALEDIVAVPGIGAIFLGPNDLAATAGHLERMDHPEVQALLQRVEQVVTAAGLPMATVRGGGRDWTDLETRGFRLVAGVTDMGMLLDGIQNARAELEGQSAAPTLPRY
ncbi:HpcH/HpaI aldolase family protein [Szabonella alba]|uniref:Aldolase n=1 Tax=Szabonella alba TaxID=2804194 RepID=A0A8K0VD76_9RHOB|nr:aldolase/citrate lyase family protein [Szabonella alba]MBL4918028.1 aldolase [Szabonella alba]